MKKLTQISLMAILLLLLTGCNPSSMLNNEQLDPSLPKLNDVQAVPSSTSVAFEWKSMVNEGVTGLNIYRTDTNQYVNSSTKQLKKIGTVHDRFATHFVDTQLKQNSSYTYTFTTVKNNFESAHGKVINVKTLAPFDPVTFFQGFQKTRSTIKLIWRPHPNKQVSWYKVERSVNSGEWKWVGTVKERMMSEYIDNGIVAGNMYTYRVIAIGFEHSFSKPSVIVSIQSR
ncbi:MAG: Putative fibronectin domain-containing lipoprotein [uncultured Sulfurovum sp.]|uniref:Fibronectin domain-containing lipoprotein n=1 Tax=uncultured Sulfurovum sp. TaxID=269237 RepID=A0A6S6SI08_9BACT|nr:MAG: Putative fibronectin domain-containing lipoprotein [uncultured Sulfurovum sp.]